jgi:hypothetical protein
MDGTSGKPVVYRIQIELLLKEVPMMKSIFWYLSLFFLLVMVLLAVPVLAKGSVGKITIESPDLADPVEITDRDIVLRFNPWAAQFIGRVGPFSRPPEVGQQAPYQVYFYLENGYGQLELSYMLYYYPQPAGTRGYIYMPGKGEPYYPVNVRTILREESDGRWHQSTPVWEDAFEKILIKHSNSANQGRPALAFIGVVAGVTLVSGTYLWSRRQ